MEPLEAPPEAARQEDHGRDEPQEGRREEGARAEEEGRRQGPGDGGPRQGEDAGAEEEPEGRHVVRHARVEVAGGVPAGRREGEADDPATLSPIYLQGPDGTFAPGPAAAGAAP